MEVPLATNFVHAEWQHSTATRANVHNAWTSLTTTQTRDKIIQELKDHNIDCRQTTNSHAYNWIRDLCQTIDYNDFRNRIEARNRAGGSLRFFVEEEEANLLHGVTCSWNVSRQGSSGDTRGFNLAITVSWHSVPLTIYEEEDDDSGAGGFVDALNEALGQLTVRG